MSRRGEDEALVSKAVESKSEDKVFAKGFCFTKLAIFFLLGCVIGTYYEQFLTLFKLHIWVRRSGLIYGPFNPVYGLGLVSFIAILGKKYLRRKWYKNYLACCLIGGGTEYVLNLAQEVLLHSKSWDYTGMFLNVGGRTTVPYMLIWGIAGMLVLYIIYPVVSAWIEKLPYHAGQILFAGAIIFIVFDMIVSATAMYRQMERKDGEAPSSAIERVYDKVYTDQFLERAYPNYAHIDSPSK